jgi:hypothetical protein
MGGKEFAERRDQPARRDRGDAGDGDFGLRPELQGFCLGGNALEADRQGVGQPLGLGCQANAALFAQEQRPAEPFLQLPDLVADGGMGDMQLVGGAREAGMPGRGLEDPECAERRHHM